MKKHGKASVSVMLALGAVLLVSLVYLSSQDVKEGFGMEDEEDKEDKKKKKKKKKNKKK